jgi:GR25 family glycosyltransferase involved in LPS biosynthesis
MSFNSRFPEPILINLDKRQDRLEAFDTQAKALGINYHRLTAIRATDPVFGCKLSHIAALSMSDKPIAFVFEDDATFIDNFYEEFEKSMQCVPDDWDMLYLGAHILQSTRVNDRWVKSIECSSTHAYAIKREVIPKLIQRTMEMKGHTDVAFSSLHKELNVYLARPTLVYQAPGFSDLQHSEVDYTDLYFR